MNFSFRIASYPSFVTSFLAYQDKSLSVCYKVNFSVIFFAIGLSCFSVGLYLLIFFLLMIMDLLGVNYWCFCSYTLQPWFSPNIKFIARTFAGPVHSFEQQYFWSFLQFICVYFKPFPQVFASFWWGWTLKRCGNEVCFFLLSQEVFSSVPLFLSSSWPPTLELWAVSSFSTIFILA